MGDHAATDRRAARRACCASSTRCTSASGPPCRRSRRRSRPRRPAIPRRLAAPPRRDAPPHRAARRAPGRARATERPALGGARLAGPGRAWRAPRAALTPLDLLRPHDAGDRVLERARHVAAAQASNIADLPHARAARRSRRDPDTEGARRAPRRAGAGDVRSGHREDPALTDALQAAPPAPLRATRATRTASRPADDGATQPAQPGESIDPS